MQPRFLQWVEVKLKQMDRDSLQLDPDTQDPVGPVSYKPVVTLRGQVNWKASHALAVGQGGLVPISNGYVIFLERELNEAGVTIGLHDVITEIDGEQPTNEAGEPVELLIVEPKPAGHYRHKTLRVAVFKEQKTGI
jgi:hypothetical protein